MFFTGSANPPNAGRDELKKIVERKPRVIKAGDPLIDDFRESMHTRSAGFRGLVCTLRKLDGNGATKLTLPQYAEGLAQYGLQYRQEELDRLFHTIDKDHSGKLSVAEFIHAVRPLISMNRVDLVKQAYYLIDRACDGDVTMKRLVSLYDTTGHPEVVVGKITPQQAAENFVLLWDRAPDSRVSLEDFMEYYADLSAGIDNDTYFEHMMHNCWHISGGDGIAANFTCMRVMVVYEDGRKGMVVLKNDLGVDRTNAAEIRKRLTKQGVSHIRDIVLA